MSAGSLTLACLLLVPGQPSADVNYVNTRGLKIGIEIEPARRREIREVVLYVSRDKGKNWDRAAGVAPDKDFFAYQAPADGEYWFLIAAVDLKGKQDPEDVYRGQPQQKTIIDTAHKPVLRIASAQRHGDELVVAWQAWSDLPPDEKSLELKYCVLDGSSPLWMPVSVVPGATGQAKAQLSGPAPVKVKMQFRDVAGNVARAEADVPGLGGATQAVKSSPVGSLPIPSMGNPPAAGAPSSPREQRDIAPPPPAPPTRIADTSAAVAPSTGSSGTSGSGAPPRPPLPSGLPAEPSPVQVPSPVHADRQVVATSRQEPQAPSPAAPPVTPQAPRGAPQVQLVNEREVSLEYELSRVGPSGIGKVTLYLTRNKGASWEEFAVDDDAPAYTAGGKYQRMLELPEGDGLYGLMLVVRNRAGIGRSAPKPGDQPEMLIEVDRTLPTATLYSPVADPQRRDALLLSWAAQDKNLPAQPVSLEWAAQPDGKWQPIASGLPAAGKHSWAVPAGTPVRVYLRLRVRDSAGNEAEAVTHEPQLVDLTEPEGRLLTVRPARKP